jgi:cytochrome c553|tara:strand:- start:14726 stop:15322 length:597 start_codon:yes stop_codon:yes gene_type:complete
MFQKYIITTLFALFFFTTLSAQEAESVAMNEKIKGKIQICVSCHGEQGATIMPVYPILAGQNFYYTYVQLKDLKSGYRKNEIMAAMVQDLEKDEMKLLAGHFSEQAWPETKHKSDAGKTDIAKMAIDAGQCVQCHRGGFEGESRNPRLSGQNYEYLKKTMLDFKNKVRTNSAAKSSLFATFSDEQIDALADYLAGFTP